MGKAGTYNAKRVMGVGAMRELAAELGEKEAALQETYEALAREVAGDAERQLAQQLASFQRLQVVGLGMLESGISGPYLGFGRIVADEVNLRAGAGGREALARRLDRGQVVIIQGFAGNWVKVACPGGEEGYFFKDYRQVEVSA